MDDQLGLSRGTVPDVVAATGGTAAIDRASFGPVAIQRREAVTGVAADQQLPPLLQGWNGVGVAAETQRTGATAVEPVEAGQVTDVAQGEVEEIVAGAAEINGLD